MTFEFYLIFFNLLSICLDEKYMGVILIQNYTCTSTFDFEDFVGSEQLCDENSGSTKPPTQSISSSDAHRNLVSADK